MITWIKNHKLATFLILVLLIVLFKEYVNPFSASRVSISPEYSVGSADSFSMGAPPIEMGKATTLDTTIYPNVPPTQSENRMVVENSHMSLLVSDVRESQTQVVNIAERAGGYMVQTNISNPEEVASANITVRVPSDKMRDVLEQYREMSVKVVSENIDGYDVTDQFVDNEARLLTLLQTKVKFEEIFDQATRIEDILNIQRELINLQSQIDAIQGQQKYLEQTSRLSLITVYLSTDELALPYAPTETWRPDVIFKQAVRSLILTFRNVGTLLIWLGVYSIVLLPVIFIVLYFVKRTPKK